MKNRGSTPILTKLVGVHSRNIHTKFEANPCSGLREEVEKLKKVHADNDDGHSLIARLIKVPSGTVVVTLICKKILIKKT